MDIRPSPRPPTRDSNESLFQPDPAHCSTGLACYLLPLTWSLLLWQQGAWTSFVNAIVRCQNGRGLKDRGARVFGDYRAAERSRHENTSQDELDWVWRNIRVNAITLRLPGATARIASHRPIGEILADDGRQHVGLLVGQRFFCCV